MCEDSDLKTESHCEFQCNPGYAIAGLTNITCKHDTNASPITASFFWSETFTDFECVPMVGVVIGGIGEDGNYIKVLKVIKIQ